MRLLEKVRSAFGQALEAWTNDTDGLLTKITATRDAQFGDYQANLALAMMLGKQQGVDAVAMAERLAAALRSNPLFDQVTVAGKGFINLALSQQFLADGCRAACQSDLGFEPPTSTKQYLVDFSSPNVAKPMHVGHIRSTVIGDAIVRTLRCLGQRVLSDNHLGDWGTQFGMVIYGYKHFVDRAAFEAAPVKELVRLYRYVQQLIGYQNAVRQADALVEQRDRALATLDAARRLQAAQPADKKAAKQLKSAERGAADAEQAIVDNRAKIESARAQPDLIAAAEAHPDLDSRVLQETAKLHAGDAENRRLWREFLPACIAEIHQVYRRLKVTFDMELGESFYHDMLGPTVDGLVERGLAQTSQGAICVFLDGFEAPMIIRKQDGAFLYSTTDLATVAYRVDQFRPDVILYVVDHRQSDHFKKLFACLNQTGFDALELRHISFGTVLGKDGRPFKTRSGDVVGLEPLLDEAVARALAVVADPERLQRAGLDLTADERQHIAEVVGIGAIKYADLSHHRDSDYEFDLDKMVALDGNTSAYIQYSFARTQNILRKLDESGAAASQEPGAWTHPMERTLAVQLLRFEDTLWQSLEDFTPSTITDYLYDLAKLFASFYEQCPVLRAESVAEQSTRRLLVELTGRTLQRGLGVLGIETIDRM